MRAPFAAVTAAITCGLLVLAGCGEESPEPKPLETASTSTTPSPSASPPPSMPAEAEEKGAKGAEAFVRHYVELMNHAQATGDTAPMQAASLKTCESCERVAQYVGRIYKSGGSISGGEMRVSKLYSVVISPDTDRYAAVDVELAVEEGRVLERDQETTGEASSSTVSFQLDHDQSWRISDWNRVE